MPLFKIKLNSLTINKIPESGIEKLLSVYLPFLNVFACNSYMEESAIHPFPSSFNGRNHLAMAFTNSTGILWIILSCLLLHTFTFFFIPFFERYKLSCLSGMAVIVLFIALGGLLSWYKNIQHDQNWFGKNYNNEKHLL